MGNQNIKSVFSGFVAALFVVGAFLPASGEIQTAFTGGALDATLTFQKGGGTDNTISVNLSKYILVSGASVDIEGRPRLYDPKSGTMDFSNPGQSTAWAGSFLAPPPAGKPVTFETTNITNDNGIMRSDDVYYQSKLQGSTPCHMFEFYTGDLLLTNLSLKWEGNGLVSGMTAGQPGAELYIYNATGNLWKKTAFYLNTPGDQALWANESAAARDFVDSRGYVTAMACANVGNGGKISTASLNTDYVTFSYQGNEYFCPTNIRLDLGANGNVDWLHADRLANKTTFTGDAFVNSLQAILDAAATENVSVKLKFTVDNGGILYVSNLSVDYTLKDRAPTIKGAIPQFELDEDTNATALINLREYFNDDKGVNSLVFTLVWEENAAVLHAALNPDGYHLDVFTALRDWNGQLRFRVKATDASDQSVEGANFTVLVNPVNDAPKLKQPSALSAKEGTPFSYTFNSTDVDIASDPEETKTFSTNGSFFSLDPGTGTMTFTPKNADVGPHNFWVRVTDTDGANDTRNVVLGVENQNNAPVLKPIEDVTVNQYDNFSLKVNATDPDLDIGLDELTFEDNSTLFQISKNGTIAFAAQEKDVGVFFVSITVRDIARLSSIQNFTITVVNVNDQPRIIGLANMSVDEDTLVSFKVNATDPDVGDVLTFSDDSNLFDISKSGNVNFTPVQKSVGLHYVNITVTDAGGLKSSFRMTITVVNVNEPPVGRIMNPANATVYDFGKNVTFEGTGTDEDGDNLTYSWAVDGAVAGQGAIYSTTKLKSGKHTISLTVSDGTVEVPAGSIEITVRAKKNNEKGLPGFELGLWLLALVGVALVYRTRRN